MRRDAKPQNLPSTMPHNQQAVEQTKRDCRYDEHIHRGDAVGMIAKERPPALGWRVSSLGHVLGHAGLSDIDADLEEFSMDPRRSPQRIGNAHLADKLAYLRRYSWSATTAPRLPPPVRSEPGAVPFNHGLRLHDRQGAQHLRSQTIQAGEYQTVQHPERRPIRYQLPARLSFRQGQPEFHRDLSGWIRDGKLVWKESVEEGIENAPRAFLKLFKGENFGKMLVKLA